MTHNDKMRQSGNSHRSRRAVIFTFKHFHLNLCVSYGKIFHIVKQAHLLSFHNYCLTLQDVFVFSSSSFRPSNSKTATTAFRFTSILALIFRTNNQQRQQQQNVVRLCQTSLATLISCHRNTRKHIFRLCNNVIRQCFLVWPSL